MRYVFTLILLAVLATAGFAQEPDDRARIEAIVKIATQFGIDPAVVADAIVDRTGAEKFWIDASGALQIVAPDEAPVGSPVLVSVDGLPEDKPYAEKWLRSPVFPEDVFLDLYDRNGRPVTVFWSSKAAKRTWHLVVATNGETLELAPELELDSHELDYDGNGPDPDPNPEPVEELWGIVIVEAEDRDDYGPDVAKVLFGQRLRAIPKFHWEVIDDDVISGCTDRVPERLKPVIDLLNDENLPMPYLFLMDQNMGIVERLPLPATVDAVIAKIKEHLP